MVNNPIKGADSNPFLRELAHLPWRPPTEEDGQSQKIGKKIWALEDIRAIAMQQVTDESATLLSAVTTDCIADLQKLEFTAVDVAERLLQLEARHYDKSMWCKKSKRPGVIVPDAHLWLPCDAYVISIVERVPSTGWQGLVEYYFKLCLTPFKKLILLVSVHP